MLLVSAGKYLAGKDAAPVEVPAFYIDKTEVTNAQYARFCQERGRPLPEGFPTDRPDLPVVNITYIDADLFAKWAGKRLPTMDEWEKAARGDAGRPYPWGQDADAAKAVLRGGELAPAGSIQAGASPYGALDMIGNVWEFVNDPRTPTPGAVNAFKTLVTPPPTATEPWFAMRGGSFRTPLDPALTYDSASVPARFKGADIGFRCVREGK
jgi:serine/threonine-protein kinase